MTEHVHDWQPIPLWLRRYKCAECGVVGFKIGKSRTPKPYKCRRFKDGSLCGQPAIQVEFRLDANGEPEAVNPRCSDHLTL